MSDQIPRHPLARADDQLAAIYLYVAAEASPHVALRFVDAIVEKCNSLRDFPNRGTPRDDVRQGVRTLAFRRRVTIAYSVEPGEVTILGAFYGGQDFEAMMREG